MDARRQRLINTSAYSATRVVVYGWVVLLMLSASCGTLKLEVVPSADQLRWQTEIGQAVNTHTKQICELQKKVFGVCASEAGGPIP